MSLPGGVAGREAGALRGDVAHVLIDLDRRRILPAVYCVAIMGEVVSVLVKVGPLINNHRAPTIVKQTAHSKWHFSSPASLIDFSPSAELHRVLTSIHRRKFTPSPTAKQGAWQGHTPEQSARQKDQASSCCKLVQRLACPG